MNWQDLVVILAQKVREGQITTYAEVSEWAFGKRNLGHPVGAMLRGAANHGFGKLTNRVIGSDGRLADLPEGLDQQKAQLVSEKVAFISGDTVDLSCTIPVILSGK